MSRTTTLAACASPKRSTMKRRCVFSITQIMSASSINSWLTGFFDHDSVPAEVTHIGAHISAISIAAVGLRSLLPVQTIRTFFIWIKHLSRSIEVLGKAPRFLDRAQVDY